MKEKEFDIAELQFKPTKESENRPVFTGIFAITYKKKTFDVDLIDELGIPEDFDLDVISRHSEKFAWWLGVNLTVSQVLRREKLRLSRLRATLYKRARKELEFEGVKITEAAIESEIVQDDSFLKKSEYVDTLQDIVDVSKAVLQGFEHRRDMLNNLAAAFLQRTEIRYNLQTNHRGVS